tara:strand:- start:1021 stop:1257 length:237 start_codon:yes stop_codon:yes gene_type:complete
LNNKKWELRPFWFPESRSHRVWAIVFVSLIILSIDWWNWDVNQRIGEWIPAWIIYLMVIQFALAYSVWKFSKEWKKDE